LANPCSEDVPNVALTDQDTRRFARRRAFRFLGFRPCAAQEGGSRRRRHGDGFAQGDQDHLQRRRRAALFVDRRRQRIRNGAPTGKPSVDPADNSVLVAPVPQALKPGVYTVTWHVVSVDTHKTQGSFNFTVAP
jgi:hypothetical protein